MNRVSFITLGCSKNDVDSSIMKSALDKEKYTYSPNPSESDIVIVNTCGFIEAAKEESIDAILEVAEYKKQGRCKKLLLAGCLAERYSDELLEEIEEIDGIIGTGNIRDLNTVLDAAFENKRLIKSNNIEEEYPEEFIRDEYNKTEYIKISEGCNNFCTYCIIPALKGKNKSRRIENIVSEVEHLANNGTEEFILIAQNTTDYGIDIYGKYALVELLQELSKIEGVRWIRVLYMYPDHFDSNLIEEFKNNDKLLKYIDIPLQHISNSVLKRMNRNTNRESIENLIVKLREEIPEIIIRTTFIVGFPGETEEDFNELYEFIKEARFDKLGVFTYSREENTPAYSMENQIDEEIKEERLESIMKLQMEISEENLERLIGNRVEALIEEQVDDVTYIGRSEYDCPDIDGVVYINSEEPLEIGTFVNIKVVDAMEYDLFGEII